MDKMLIAKAFNEWMRLYTESPEEFERDWVTVTGFLKQKEGGVEPSYGECCAEYLEQLLSNNSE